MKYLFFGFLMMWMGAQVALAQIDPEDESLSWKGKLKKADRLMESGSFYNAIDYYKAVVEERPDMSDVALKLGHTMSAARNYKEAVVYYKMAFDASNDDYRIAQYYYALMLKMGGQYEEARDNFEEFRRRYQEKGPEAIVLKRLAKTESDGCTLALGMVNETPNIEFTHMSGNINALYTEFSPRLVQEDSLLIFGSMRVDSVPVLESNKTKLIPKAQLLQSFWNGQEWTKAREMDGPFNEEDVHTGNGSFTQDGKRFFFTRCTDDGGVNVRCDIYVSELEEGEWSRPKKVSINDPYATNTHPIIVPYSSRGEEMLMFVSNREGGQGGLDIWYSVIDRSGEFSEPRNMGRRINTPNDELTPYYDFKEEILYFSSNGLTNIGGYDIFMSKGSGRRWAVPINMGMPINSPVDDFYYIQYADGEKGFIVSNRDGSISPKWPNCCDDIWAFEYVYPPVFTIIGQVFEKGDSTRTPLDSANVELFLADTDRLLDSSVTADKAGAEFFVGSQFANFRLEARKPGYTYGLNTTSTVGLEESDTLYVDIFLTPISDIGTIVLRNVYFDLDKADIREDAMPSLDSVYQILTLNPNIRIELSSHTDSRAPKDYNIDLSQRRAESSKAYLVAKGIAADRIEAVGYGEEMLLNDCADGVPCTDIEHQVNRRTEFKIIGEIPNAIVTYDRSEIEAIQEKKRQGTLKGNEAIWEFEGAEEESEEF